MTQHGQAHQTSFAGAGDLTGRDGAVGFSPAGTARPFVTGLDVRASARDGVVAAIGDSVSDGDQRSATLQELGVDEDARYPDFLARRMFWYRRRQNVKPRGLSGSPWLIGTWRFRPLVRMVDRCAAAPMTVSPSATASASANRLRRVDASRAP